MVKEYGGRKSRGSKGKHKSPGSGSIVRKALQQLEKAGLVKNIEGEGRTLTGKGRSLLDKLSYEIKKMIEKDLPELQKYG